MKIFKRVIFILITSLLVLVLMFNVYNFVCIKLLHKDLPTINGYGVLEVASGSMEPTLRVGDLIVINTKAKNYQENDIITFYDVNGSFVTHRLLSFQEDNMMVTKGDNNDSVDEAISRDNIVGKYVFKISALGSIMASFKNPLVSIMIFVIGLVICYLLSIDKDGNPIIEDEEYQQYLEEKENKEEVKKENIFLRIKNFFKKDKKKSKKKANNKKKKKKKTTKKKNKNKKKKK